MHGIPVQVIFKEAVYHAVAVGAYELFDFVDFPAWLHGALLQVLQQYTAWCWPGRSKPG